VTDLISVRATLAKLTEEADVFTAVDVWQRLERFKGDVAEILDQYKAALLAWCIANARGITVGDIRIYAGTKKETKCTDVKKAVETLLALHDVEGLVQALSAQPFANGRAKELVGEGAELLWKTAEIDDLKTGKPAKELKQVNTRFISAGKSGNGQQGDPGGQRRQGPGDANDSGRPERDYLLGGDVDAVAGPVGQQAGED
jgi:hypothetical protein